MTANRRVIAQITDPHVRVDAPQSGTALGLAIDYVIEHRQLIDAVVITGDLADTAQPSEYAQVAEELQRLPVPFAVVPGNHDDREHMRRALALDGDPASPIERVITVPGLRVIAVDTSVPGADHGSLDTQLLRTVLAKAPPVPTVLAMHHPPCRIGIGGLDEIALDGSSTRALEALVSAAPQVSALIAGHVHRAALATLAGVPVITAPAAGTQLALNIGSGAVEYDAHEPPALLMHVVTDGEVVTHVVWLSES